MVLVRSSRNFKEHCEKMYDSLIRLCLDVFFEEAKVKLKKCGVTFVHRRCHEYAAANMAACHMTDFLYSQRQC